MSYYEVLNVEKGATIDQIRKNYQHLALEVRNVGISRLTKTQLHPDRVGNDKYQDKFIKVQKAWETLRDDERRREYDNLLQGTSVEASLNLVEQFQRSQLIISTVVNTDEMDWNQQESMWTYGCRCGDVFCVSEHDLDHGPVIVPCQGCSLGLEIHTANK